MNLMELCYLRPYMITNEMDQKIQSKYETYL